MNIFFLFFVFFWYYNPTWVLSSAPDHSRLLSLWRIVPTDTTSEKTIPNYVSYILWHYVWLHLEHCSCELRVWTSKPMRYLKSQITQAEHVCVLHWNVIAIVGLCCSVITKSLPNDHFQIERIPRIFLNKPEMLYSTTIVAHSVSIVWCLEKERV